MSEGPTAFEPRASREALGDQPQVEEAVRNLQAGIDVEGSFDFLFRRFSPALKRQLMRWGAAAEEARDLNQEIFQRIFLDIESFRGGDPLFPSWVGWIWKIARTSWLRGERAKRARKRPANPQALEGIDGERQVRLARPPPQLDGVLAREREDQVRRALAELPEQELKCVVLHYYQELKTHEIAVILRVAPGTVKAHLHHARAKLKARLGGWPDFDDLDRAGGPEPSPGEQRV